MASIATFDRLVMARRLAQGQWMVKPEARKDEVNNVLSYPAIPMNSFLGLRPHQIEHARRLVSVLRTKGRAGDTSEPGSGKTYVGADCAKELGLPVVLLTPLAVIKVWYDILHEAGVPIVSITNYDMARASHSETIAKWYDMRNGFTAEATPCPWISKRKLQMKKSKVQEALLDTKGVVQFDWHLPYKCFIIFDEEHMGKNIHTQTFALMKGAMEDAKRMGHKILYISATPTEKKENLKSILYFLGLVPKPDMNSVKAHFQREIGSNETIDIHHYLYNVDPEHPEKSTGYLSFMPKAALPPGITNDVKPMTYPMDEETTRKIAQKSEIILSIKKLLKEKIYDNSLGSLNESLRFIENYKMPKAEQLAVQALEGTFPVEPGLCRKFQRVCIFVNYKSTLRQLKASLEAKKLKISVLHGDQKAEESRESIKAYMTKQTQVMISTIKKGGTALSLHDTVGDMETLVIILPPTSYTSLYQCLGRHFRTDVMSSVVQRVLFTAGDKVEESMRDGLALKLTENHLITTGKEADFDLYDLAIAPLA